MADTVIIGKYRKLIESLYKKTDSGNLTWEPSVLFGGFETRVGDKLVIFDMVHTGASVPDYEIKIANAELKIVESFRDTDLHDEGASDVLGFPTYFRLMEAMYGSIQRKNSGVEAILDDLIDNLS
ncbi:hypothetical protein BrevBR_09090 [Brevundimonas sp. BR2-1]|uniref:hypothetical protein n=1 Tax=Brevundimonas sp. BR2-1 TaxID=3031123 RepID=UPI0030A5130C